MKRSILSLCVAMMFTVVLGMIFCCQNLYGETSDDNTAAFKKDDFTVRIKDVKHKDGAIKISWEKLEKAEEYVCTLYDGKGKNIIGDWNTTKTWLVIKRLNPGEKYIFDVYPQYTENNDTIHIGGTGAVSFRVPKEHDYPTYKTAKSASNALYKAITKKEKQFTCYIPYKKKLSAEKLMGMALTEKRYGDFIRTNIWYYGVRKTKINIIPQDNTSALTIRINGKRYAKYSYQLDYYTTASQDKEFDQEVTKLVKKLKLRGTNAEKIRIVTKYINRNVKSAKRKNTLNNTAYGALTRGSANCTGKAALAYVLLRKASVDTRIMEGGIHGKSKSPVHYVNLVKRGQKYYYLDVHAGKGLLGKKDRKYYDYFLDGSKLKRKYREKRIAQLGRDIGL